MNTKVTELNHSALLQQQLADSKVNQLVTQKFSRKPLDQPDYTTTDSFEVSIAINPLIAACAPMLSVVSHLSQDNAPLNIEQLYYTLCQEIKTFENKALKANYRSPVILAARYLLCCFIDEAIITTKWGKKSQWCEKNLLKYFQSETDGNERFFLILERSCEDPQLHIDLLELGYICLSLGHQGKYRGHEDAQQQLGNIIDKLYYLICQVRGEFRKECLLRPQLSPSTEVMTKRSSTLWAAGVMLVSVLAAIYLPYHLHLNKVSAPINQTLDSVLAPSSTPQD